MLVIRHQEYVFDYVCGRALVCHFETTSVNEFTALNPKTRTNLCNGVILYRFKYYIRELGELVHFLQAQREVSNFVSFREILIC